MDSFSSPGYALMGNQFSCQRCYDGRSLGNLKHKLVKWDKTCFGLLQVKIKVELEYIG